MTQTQRLLPIAAIAFATAALGLGHAQSAFGRSALGGGTAGWEENGEASWYGGKFIGRRTSSGERFDGSAMTAAHSTLPLGSRVRVTMQDTGDSVVVRITDRLPPHGVRVIDLSRGAAARLGMIGRGTGWVTLTPAAPGGVDEVAEAPDALDGPTSTPRRHGPRHRRHAGR